MTARAPGKLIISGEHAVVYGSPALLMAVNRYTTCRLELLAADQIHCSFGQQRYTLDLAALSATVCQLKDRYSAFLAGQRPIQAVLRSPAELLYYLVAELVTRLTTGLAFQITTQLPIGCGLGASAALITAGLQSIMTHYAVALGPEERYTLALHTEQLQHGYASGADVRMALTGGVLRFQRGVSQALPAVQHRFWLLHTGPPACTTGECVAWVKARFGTDRALWQAFTDVTHALQTSLAAPTTQELAVLIRANHRLLVHLGVVPAAIQTLIQQIEQRGGSAKICGAGAITGHQAGVVLVVWEDAALQQFCQTHALSCFSVQGTAQGVHVV